MAMSTPSISASLIAHSFSSASESTSFSRSARLSLVTSGAQAVCLAAEPPKAAMGSAVTMARMEAEGSETGEGDSKEYLGLVFARSATKNSFVGKITLCRSTTNPFSMRERNAGLMEYSHGLTKTRCGFSLRAAALQFGLSGLSVLSEVPMSVMGVVGREDV